MKYKLYESEMYYCLPVFYDKTYEITVIKTML